MRQLTWLVQSLQIHSWLRHLLFLGAAISAMAMVGYHMGGYDQVIYLPFLKSWADPNLYPGDAFIALKTNQPSYFWLFFVPFYRAGLLAATVFIVMLVSVYLTFWAIWELSLALFGSALAAFISVVIFIFPHTGFTGFPVIESILCNRTFVLPFLLFAITLYLRRKVLWAFLLLGLMYNLHLLSVNFVVGMLLFDGVLRWRLVGWRSLLGGAALFILAALPVLVWRGSSGAGLDVSLRPEWLSVVSRGMLGNVYYLVNAFPLVILSTFNGLGVLALLAFLRKRYASPWHDRSLIHFCIAAGLVMAVETIAVLWLPVTFILQLQLLRIGVFFTLFSLLLLANFLANMVRKRMTPLRDLLALGAAFTVLPFSIFGWASWAVYRLTRRWPWRWAVSLVVTALLTAASGIIVVSAQFWKPGIYFEPPDSSWLQVMRWAQTNTPLDAVFITPPEKFSLNEPEWRVFAERSKVVALSDLAEVALAPDYLPTWKERFTSLAPGALEQFRGDFFANQAITRRAFDGLPTTYLLQSACRFQASYLVVEADRQRELPVVYRNEGYIVYDLRTAKPCP